MKDAVRRGHLASSPVLDPPARDDSVERHAWTLDETRTFLAVASGDRLEAVWRLALATDARRGELLGLQWPDVDDGAATIARQVLLGSGYNRMHVRETTKTRRVRRVRFDETTARRLRAWRVTQEQERRWFSEAWKTDGGLGVEADWIVTEPDGAVVHPGHPACAVGRAGTQGRRHADPASRSAPHVRGDRVAAGVRLDVVSRQLGHASIATTGNIYTHDSDEAAQEAAQRVGGILGE